MGPKYIQGSRTFRRIFIKTSATSSSALSSSRWQVQSFLGQTQTSFLSRRPIMSCIPCSLHECATATPFFTQYVFIFYYRSPADAWHCKTVVSLGVLRNHLASSAIAAVQRHLITVFRKMRLDTTNARAGYIASLFVSATDHPIIWREYVEGNIQNHPEVGGYRTVRHSLFRVPLPSECSVQTRRGVFLSEPILGTLCSYYSAYGIMEDPPLEDPGAGNRPMGILALVAAAVCHDLTLAAVQL
jgi:hypothetical protein